MREPPRPPLMNPWDWQVKVPSSGSRTSEEVEMERKTARDESPVLPTAYPSVEPHARTTAGLRPPSTVHSQSDHGEQDVERRLSTNSQSTTSERGIQTHHFHYPQPRQKHPRMSSFASSIPENAVSQEYGAIPFFQTTTAPYSPTQTSWPRQQPSSPMSANSDDSPRPDFVNLSPQQHRRQNGAFSEADLIPTHPPPPPPIQPAPDAASASVLAQMDAGPIPVETEEASRAPARFVTAPPDECKIEADSSFHLAKGFCQGAQDVIRGGVGVKRTRKQVRARHPSV